MQKNLKRRLEVRVRISGRNFGPPPETRNCIIALEPSRPGRKEVVPN